MPLGQENGRYQAYGWPDCTFFETCCNYSTILLVRTEQAIITCNNSWSLHLHIVLFPRTPVELFISKYNLICFDMATMRILLKESINSIEDWSSGEGFFYLPSNTLQCNSGLKYELRVKGTCIIKDYQDYTTANWFILIYLSLLFSTYLINKNNCRDLTAMKECNVNHMKLFKSEEKYITVKRDIWLDLNEQCPAQLMLLFGIIFSQERERCK